MIPFLSSEAGEGHVFTEVMAPSLRQVREVGRNSLGEWLSPSPPVCP